MNLYQIFLNLHSVNRYLVIAVLIVAIFGSLAKMIQKGEFSKGDHTLSLAVMIIAHLQLLMGFVLYFVSPLVRFEGGVMKNPTYRYWTTEHLFMMLLAIAFITWGRISMKKKLRAMASGASGSKSPQAPHRTLLIFNALALLSITISLLAMLRV